MNFLMFVMITAMFVYTFFNFFAGVWSTMASKVAGSPVGGWFSSVEGFFGNMFGSVVNFFKKL